MQPQDASGWLHQALLKDCTTVPEESTVCRLHRAPLKPKAGLDMAATTGEVLAKHIQTSIACGWIARSLEPDTWLADCMTD